MKRLFTLLVVPALILSCELVVDVDVPFEAKQVTANAFFNPDSVWSVQLSMNRNILDDEPFQYVDNAQVIIYEDENAIATLANVGNGLFRSGTLAPEPEKAYILIVKVSGYTDLQARSAIPHPAPITGVDLYETSSNSKIKVRIKDDGSQANFYEIQVAVDFEVYNYPEDRIDQIRHRIQLSSDDPLIQNDDDDFSYDIIFRDVLFNGKEAELNFGLSGGGVAYGGGVTVILKTLSDDGYNYLRTLRLNDMTSGDPFAQPVNVYSNIHNGFGIFAGYSTSNYTHGNPRPAITSIDPPSGKSGDRVVITGDNFIPEERISVAFQSHQYTTRAQIVSISPTRIEAVVPPNAITGKVLVQNGKIGVSDNVFVITD